MPSNSQPWATRDDYTALSLLVVVAGVCFGLFMLWHYQHQWIAWGFAMVAHRQIAVYRLFTHHYDRLDDMLAHADYWSVTLGQIWHVMTVVGTEVRTPACILIALLAIPCYVLAAPSRFTRSFDLSGLIQEQARSFPAIRVIAGRELRLVRPAELVRPLDPALTVIEWMERHAPGDGLPAEAAMRSELTRQLGRLWQGPQQAAPIERILFVAFTYHHAGKRKQAQDLLTALSTEVGSQSVAGEAGPAALLEAPAAIVAAADQALAQEDLKTSLQIVGRHAYTNTALMSLLNEARRKRGVLPPATFLATKLIDRPLWYALHALGFPGGGPGQNAHPNPRVEAAGCRAHWQAECLAGRPIILPHLDAAVTAIRAMATQTGPRNQEKEVKP